LPVVGATASPVGLTSRGSSTRAATVDRDRAGQISLFVGSYPHRFDHCAGAVDRRGPPWIPARCGQTPVRGQGQDATVGRSAVELCVEASTVDIPAAPRPAGWRNRGRPRCADRP